jgi:hypothetical protein
LRNVHPLPKKTGNKTKKHQKLALSLFIWKYLDSGWFRWVYNLPNYDKYLDRFDQIRLEKCPKKWK